MGTGWICLSPRTINFATPQHHKSVIKMVARHVDGDLFNK